MINEMISPEEFVCTESLCGVGHVPSDVKEAERVKSEK